MGWLAEWLVEWLAGGLVSGLADIKLAGGEKFKYLKPRTSQRGRVLNMRKPGGRLASSLKTVLFWPKRKLEALSL